VRVLLVSTYELGHQPLHVASPAAALTAAGHEVRCADVALGPLDASSVAWADVVACSVPMHTAMRMARSVVTGVREQAPEVPICLYGLYAVLDGAAGASPVADIAIAGEYETALVSWLGAGAPRPAPGAPLPTAVTLGRSDFGLPARGLLEPLGRYARLAIDGEERLAGYVEASHGCAHRCRHCPVPVVYDGRTRIVGEDVLVADVAQLVEAGAKHVTFGDPDFLNGPHHARRVLGAVHDAFPELTYDVTVKVEHILAHAGLWPEFAAAGVLFAVSAFESASDDVLAILDKGHTVADEFDAVCVLRASGIEPRPSLLPFTPWSTAGDVLDLLDLVARCDLVGNVDPVQYAIRLLVPPGSLLLSSGALDGRLDHYDAARLGWSWRAPDSRLDTLAEELAALADTAAAQQWTAADTYARVRALAFESLDPAGSRDHVAPVPDPALRSTRAPDARPRLTESWFCCAEPTMLQLAASEVAAPTTDTRCLVP
jgi:radical SAM superfamily enzyme YgiQ (UPF0313 family)